MTGPQQHQSARRRWRLLALLVVFSCLIALVFWSRDDCGVNKKRFLAVEKGMTRQQAIASVGVPPGDYRTNPDIRPFRLVRPGPIEYEYWICNDAEVLIWFDSQDKVRLVSIERVIDERPGFLDWLLDW